MTVKQPCDLFTPEENLILQAWLESPSPEAKSLELDAALQALGFVKETLEEPYNRLSAAVAFIVLEAIEKRLPQWGCYRGEELVLARQYRDSDGVPKRRISLKPQHLFTINWATSCPGFPWPAAYYVAWLPGYDRFVVTESADTAEVLGYADLALGHFDKDTDIREGAREIIVGDWTYRRDCYSQEHWECVFGTGLIREDEVCRWAAEAWPNEDEIDVDEDEPDRVAS